MEGLEADKRRAGVLCYQQLLCLQGIAFNTFLEDGESKRLVLLLRLPELADLLGREFQLDALLNQLATE